jgi:hypothetical protein
MIPITIGNNTYKSISSAWRNESPEGLKMVTVRWRLKNGWSTDHAFWTPMIPPVLRRLGRNSAIDADDHRFQVEKKVMMKT